MIPIVPADELAKMSIDRSGGLVSVNSDDLPLDAAIDEFVHEIAEIWADPLGDA